MNSIDNMVKDTIKIERKQLEPCLQIFDIFIPADKIDACLNKVALVFVKEAKLPGFRQGKAPLPMIKKMYQKNIENETLSELMSTTLNKIAQDFKDIDAISYNFPKDRQGELKPGTDFSFSIRCNTAPNFTLPQYKGIAIEIEKQEIKESDINKVIDYYRDLYGKFEKVDSAAEEDDMIAVSYTSDFKFPENTSDHIKRIAHSDFNYIWLNKKDDKFIPGINEKLMGTKPGDKIKFQTTFPADYEEKAIADKTVNYEIIVDSIQRKKPLTSDEELCSKLKAKDINELKEKIKKQKEHGIEDSYNAAKRNKVFEIVTKDLDFPLPPDMLTESTANEFSRIASEKIEHAKDKTKAQEEIKQNKDKLMEEAKEAAIKKLRNFLLLKKIGNLENIKVSEEEIDRYIQNVSYYYGSKPEEIKRRLIENGNISYVSDEVLINKVTDFMAKHADVTYIESEARS